MKNENDIVDVLIAEDSDYDAEMALAALEDTRVTSNIHRVIDGAEALDFLFGKGKYEGRETNNTPKLILLDIKMPRLDGLQALEQIRENEHTKNIPVVMMTSSKEESDLVKSYDLGANSYIVKPVDFDKFSEAVKEVGMYWLVLNQPAK